MLAQDSMWRTPLHEAAEANQFDIVKLMAQHAYDWNQILGARDKNGKLAYECALDRGHVTLSHRLVTWSEPPTEITWPSMANPVDKHFRIGITAKGFMAVLKAFGFWKNGSIDNSAVTARSENGLDWVTKAGISPRQLCGYDITAAIKAQLKADPSLKALSMCEIMLAANHPSVGDAIDFLSHAQAESLEQTLTAMMLREIKMTGPRFFFLDYPCIRQAVSNDFNEAAVEDSIKNSGHTTMMTLPIESPQVLNRIYCLLELGCTLRNGIDFDIISPPGAINNFMRALAANYDYIAGQFANVDIEQAGIRPGQENDKEAILSSIQQRTGIADANATIRNSIIVGTLTLMMLSYETFSDDTNILAALRLFAEFLPYVSPRDALAILRLHDAQGNILLHWAATHGTPEIIEAILAVVGNERTHLLQAVRSDGRTPKALAEHTAKVLSEKAREGQAVPQFLRNCADNVGYL